MDKPTKDNIKIARQCMDFSGITCDNKTCTNEYCPLNEVYDLVVTSNVQNNKEKNKSHICEGN